MHNKPTLVVCYTMLGPVPAAKVTLRCKTCGTNYRYDQYGGEDKGYRYYKEPQPFIRASNISYVERRNKYISLCYVQGRNPVQPRVRYSGDIQL